MVVSSKIRFFYAYTAVLRIAYEQLNTRVVNADIQSLSVRAVEGGIWVDNARTGSICQVFLTSGLLVKTVTISDKSAFISLSKGQSYIINVGGKTLKVAQ